MTAKSKDQAVTENELTDEDLSTVHAGAGNYILSNVIVSSFKDDRPKTDQDSNFVADSFSFGVE